MGTQLPLPKKGAKPPIFSPCLLWPNGSMDQDATWCKGRPWPRPHCVTWGSSSPYKRAHPQFLAHVYCGQMVVHLSYCWALVLCLFCVVHFFWLVNVWFCCVRFSFSIASQETGLGNVSKMTCLCRVGRKNHNSLTQLIQCVQLLWCCMPQ